MVGQWLASIFGSIFLFITGWFSYAHTVPARALATTTTPASPQSVTENTSSGSQTSSGTASSQTEAAFTGYPEGSPWQTTLPFGDSKYVTESPKQGYIYLCNVASGGEGAQGMPTWIHGSTWDPAQKVAVEGSVSWPNAVYSMTISGSTRTIKSNGLPTDHPTGTFPIQASDPAYQFDENPNSIEAQDYSFSFPAYPTMLATPDCIYGEVGIMNDGVPLFDGFDAEYRDAVAHETQDAWDGHPDMDGIYHDHGFEDSVMQNTSVTTVVGFAFDGYPITGGKLPSGNYLTTADLDECHGMTSPITLDGKTVTTYHYVLTQDFPYSVSCFRGKSYEPKPGAPTQSTQSQSTTSGGGSPPSPPEAAIEACEGKVSGASCSVNGGPSGTCATIGGSFACKPSS